MGRVETDFKSMYLVNHIPDYMTKETAVVGKDDETDLTTPGPSLFNCLHCSEKFSEKEDLENHIKISHADQIHFKCDKCEYETKNKEEYNNHILVQHTKKRTFSESFPEPLANNIQDVATVTPPITERKKNIATRTRNKRTTSNGDIASLTPPSRPQKDDLTKKNKTKSIRYYPYPNKKQNDTNKKDNENIIGELEKMKSNIKIKLNDENSDKDIVDDKKKDDDYKPTEKNKSNLKIKTRFSRRNRNTDSSLDRYFLS